MHVCVIQVCSCSIRDFEFVTIRHSGSWYGSWISQMVRGSFIEVEGA